MPSARGNVSLPKLTKTEYKIADNVFHAYVNASDELVFVVDYTVNDDKPNALLIINNHDNRKWDDILSNDYGIDLETVRPKVDNKYQKLDIEYGGLDIYAELIRAYDNDDDTIDAINKLQGFRIESIRRSAQMRLDSAQKTIENAHETIIRTNETIGELNSHKAELQSKLAQQRSTIGREPTKQSAAKILRTESQIDATNEKIARAKRRIANAERRITIATADANAAMDILNKKEPVIKQGENMADEEIKPLFDTDPEIMDEDNAFKPITFDAPAEKPSRPQDTDVPLSFTPPVSNNAPLSMEPIGDIDDDLSEYNNKPETPVELDETFSDADTIAPEPQMPVLDTITPVPESEPVAQQPVQNIQPQPRPYVPTPTPVTNNTNDEPLFRPASPVTGTSNPQTSTKPEAHSRRPGFMYYVLLIALIILSIYTLWLYQKSNPAGTIPEILNGGAVTENTAIIDTAAQQPIKANPTPEQVATQNAEITTPEKIVEPVIVEPEPVVVEPEPIIVEPETITPQADFTITNQNKSSAAIMVDTESEPRIIDEVVDKPSYNVSQNENMFVSESDYLSETSETCPDGTSPDRYGCCAGEEYTDLGDGFGCCADGECYPPLF
ncbi:MAG: hypothetical protein ACLRFJ_02855 [Alphaproteobacteria bacterium]